ncbi:nitric oxide reductase activation protein NorD [Nocardia bovistercoris]|uniref:VWA domain-containing protein n=1 Tax=Nocardia bovistercoris TaxID=2785916 RepID=A0A931IAT4_9NOCA|nr:VWA domain-containing protein [Nocardia bovistercoris]MBH0778019.1 VWA domain-containing protein [Nocardia bovistercoris]
MTTADPDSPARFRLLATFVAGRPVEVAPAPKAKAAYTTGRTIFLTPGLPVTEQRRELLVQAALLGAGSLHPRLVRPLRRRPALARRYLALEGRRALAGLAGTIPLAAELSLGTRAWTATCDESLAMARGRRSVPDPPHWFGVIRPARLLATTAGPGTRPNGAPGLGFEPPPEDDADEGEGPDRREIANQDTSPLFMPRTLMDLIRGRRGGRMAGRGPAGAGAVHAVRRARLTGTQVRPAPTRRRRAEGKPVAGASGALYPEWDVHRDRYRIDWCRVVDHPLEIEPAPATEIAFDDVLLRRLARIGQGLEVVRGRPDGDELDLDAMTDLLIDLRSGHSPHEHVYSERRKRHRDLGVLILLDASGSATDSDSEGRTVHDHQRRAAATLAHTLEELGDRVAVYAFRSHGRHTVHLPAVKTFGQRFGATQRARLDQLRPSGYTRLGAGLRAAGEILRSRAETNNRLLVLLSDGLPYEDGYEGIYAEADVGTALEELRAEGVGCLCLSLGGGADLEALQRVFGSASYATARTLAELSPRMDEIFLSCLRAASARGRDGT